MRSRSRSVLAGFWLCAVMVPLTLVLFGGWAATSIAAGSAGSGTEARRPVSAQAGKLVAKYTTADSDTYRLPNGHMLTRVYEHPVNRRDAKGQWQPLTEKQSAAASKAAVSPALSATPDAERNPLGEENETACTLTSTTPTTSACNELTFKAGYETSTKAARRALVQFGLPDLHEELTVLSAQLELYAAKTTTSTGVAMGAYRVTTPWTTKATWNTSNGSTTWHTAGGDYANPEKESDAAINSAVGATTGWTYWYPTRMVQEWYNGTDAPSGQGQPDLGFLLKDVSEGATNNVVTFDGREERERDPGLTLEWVQRGVGNATNYTQLPIQLSSTQSLDVNPASGNLSIHSTDLQIPSKGLAFESARTWNSLDNEAPDYGYGWVDNNAVYVEAVAGGNVAYTDSSGNTFPFIKEAAEKFRTPSGIEATMCEAKSASPCPATLPSGVTYQLIYSNTGERVNFGHKEVFEPAVYYYVTSVENASGDKQTAHYTGSLEYPTSWIDSEGTEIAYTESAAKGYTKITDVGNGHSTSYTEPDGEDGLYHLTEYLNEHKEKTTYRYGGESYLEGNLLTEITEPSGNITKLTYNSDYQITKIVRLPSGQKTGPTTTYTYYELGKAPAPCTSTQKATVVAETGGSEEPTLTYCANVLDEVEAVYGYPATGQPGWYPLEETDVGPTEKASVNLVNGDFFVKAEDLAPAAETLNMPLDRFYNSQAMPAANTLSPKWRWGTGPAVYLAIEGATVVLHGPSGYTVVLKRTSNSAYSDPEEYEATLTKNANGTFTLTEPDNPTLQFNAAGILTSETTETGNTFSITDTTISEKSVLRALSPPSGKALEVTYNATPLVTQTTDSASHVRKYEYNAQKQLSLYTAPSGAKTEYAYNTSGYLDKITTSEGIESITTTGAKVSEVSFAPTGGEAYGEKFSYQTPAEPACNPSTTKYETVVTSEPSGSATTFCYDTLGRYIAPPAESEAMEEGSGTPPEVTPKMCLENPEVTKEECELEEEPPEATEDLPTADYGVADDNWLLFHPSTPKQEKEKENPPEVFNIFKETTYFKELKVKWVRRVVPWNMVSEAEHNEELSEDNPGAAQRLEDVEDWIKEVKASGAEPFVSFDDECPAPAPKWSPPGKLTGTSYPCSKAPEKAQYLAAVEKFLKPTEKHAILAQVYNFASLNEPDNAQLNKAKEPLKPTYSPLHVENVNPKYTGAELAGQYWNALSSLCTVARRTTEKRPPCHVSAGEFDDSYMPNAATSNGNPKGGYAYFWGYVKGMGHPLTASRWAWHAYGEGEETETKYHGGSHKKWWQPLHRFEEAIDKLAKNSKHTQPNVLLTEQGVEYFYGEHVTPAKTWQVRSNAEEIMNAFVKDPGQLSDQKQLTRFFYYSMRGEPGFDSGLLEAAKLPEHESPKTGVSQPRSIYRIYKEKTPGG